MSAIKNAYASYREYILLAAAVLCCLFISYFYIGYSRELGSDATEFKKAALFLSEGGSISKQILMDRVLTSPLFLYISVALNSVVHDIPTSFTLINMVFYPLVVYAFYRLALEIYEEKRIALVGSLLVAFNFYVIHPGNAFLADMSGWFFFLLSTAFAVRFIKSRDRKWYYVSIILGTIGFFFKEYGALALGNLALLIFVFPGTWKTKIKDVIVAGMIFFIPFALYHAYIYQLYHISYLDKFFFVGDMARAPGYQGKSFVLFIKIIFWVFSLGWIAFLKGTLEEIKFMDKTRIKILLALFPVTMTFLVWPAITERLAVILMFWLSLIAGFGLSKLKWYMLYSFLGAYILFNCNIKILIDLINLPF